MSIQPALFEWSLARPPRAPAVVDMTVAKARGAVFTRRTVVDFMLDLVGYTTDQPLHRLRLLEPSSGGGGFVRAAVERLLAAWRSSDDAGDDSMLDGAIRAVELDTATFERFRVELAGLLRDAGLSELSAQRLVRSWLVHQDYLAEPVEGVFDVIVGNPPYVRQENLDTAALARYRETFGTMVGRADLYVAFFERSLDLLADGGRLSFICADAWTKNDYGRELRRRVSGSFALRTYVDMYGVDAFESEVGAYTSITVIERGEAGAVRTARAASADAPYLGELASELRVPSSSAGRVAEVGHPARGTGPWLLHTNRRLDALRLIEERWGSLEHAGCRVGIGVATGADKVFVAPFDALDVEPSRKLPLAVNRDVVGGRLGWTGLGVVNPWADDGGLVALDEFPRLAAFLEPHRDRLARRHTARRDVDRLWYKTIDRITPSLTQRQKLLVPDIRGNGDAIAFDPGELYPHHNLYFVTSAEWDLRALQAVLRSGIAKLFVEAYAVRIGGGYLRFQAQYLRRIRLPRWLDVPLSEQDALAEAGRAGQEVAPEVLEAVYGLPAGSLECLAEETAV
jgi:hypothetical protein